MLHRRSTPFWRDVRFLRVASQALFLLAVVLLIYFFVNNMLFNLAKRGMNLGFDFLRVPASFALGESVIDFDPSHSYGRAFLAGLLNTLKVALIGIPLATIVGILIGIARLSTNWLVARLATVYVEVLRNTPLLVQCVFWYFAVFTKMPAVRNQIALPGPVYLNNRGLSMVWFDRTATFGLWALLVLAGLVAGVALWRWWTRKMVETGRDGYPTLAAIAVVLGVALAGWYLLPEPPATLNFPAVVNQNVRGGAKLSPELSAILFALVFYTASYIAEVVRAGVQAVSKGQVEAARALGLKPGKVMQLVVFPQALRVIIPPLTSQYLNLTKNSSLASVIGFPDLFYIAMAVQSQSGRVIESFLLIMAVYLTFSLTTSLLMNIYNRAVRLTER
ncbi:MAG: amino acid ABC transporter permease [Bacillota bacterium]